jgi:hypothetical protein
MLGATQGRARVFQCGRPWPEAIRLIRFGLFSRDEKMNPASAFIPAALVKLVACDGFASSIDGPAIMFRNPRVSADNL